MTETDPENRLIGYTRVSTFGQTLDTQLEQLRAAGCSSPNIYREKVTGARADRRELLRMLDQLAPGDVVTVTRIDRLARSTRDLLDTLAAISGKQADSVHSATHGPTPRHRTIAFAYRAQGRMRRSR